MTGRHRGETRGTDARSRERSRGFGKTSSLCRCHWDHAGRHRDVAIAEADFDTEAHSDATASWLNSASEVELQSVPAATCWLTIVERGVRDVARVWDPGDPPLSRVTDRVPRRWPCLLRSIQWSSDLRPPLEDLVDPESALFQWGRRRRGVDAFDAPRGRRIARW